MKKSFRQRFSDKQAAFTLLELLLVLTLISLLVCLAAWGSQTMTRERELQRAGHQLLEDLKQTQSQAEMNGSFTLSHGALVMQRVFLVFNPELGTYQGYQWQDHNGNGISEEGEAEQLWQKGLPGGVTFGFEASIERRACSNVNNPPGEPISFASPDYFPCNDRPCIKFDQHGFSVMGPGTIYLQQKNQSLAISGTRPGHFTMCQWNGERWR